MTLESRKHRLRLIRNVTKEGIGGAVVNCAFRAPTNSYGQEDFAVKLRNYTQVAQAVLCTGVIGVADGNRTYAVKTLIAPAADIALAIWTFGTDNDGATALARRLTSACNGGFLRASR